MPPVGGNPIYPTEDIGAGWYVNAAYEHPDIAADLLDFVFFRDESRQQMLESGDNVPVGDTEGNTLNSAGLLGVAVNVTVCPASSIGVPGLIAVAQFATVCAPASSSTV